MKTSMKTSFLLLFPNILGKLTPSLPTKKKQHLDVKFFKVGNSEEGVLIFDEEYVFKAEGKKIETDPVSRLDLAVDKEYKFKRVPVIGTGEFKFKQDGRCIVREKGKFKMDSCDNKRARFVLADKSKYSWDKFKKLEAMNEAVEESNFEDSNIESIQNKNRIERSSNLNTPLNSNSNYNALHPNSPYVNNIYTSPYNNNPISNPNNNLYTSPYNNYYSSLYTSPSNNSYSNLYSSPYRYNNPYNSSYPYNSNTYNSNPYNSSYPYNSNPYNINSYNEFYKRLITLKSIEMNPNITNENKEILKTLLWTGDHSNLILTFLLLNRNYNPTEDVRLKNLIKDEIRSEMNKSDIQDLKTKTEIQKAMGGKKSGGGLSGLAKMTPMGAAASSLLE